MFNKKLKQRIEELETSRALLICRCEKIEKDRDELRNKYRNQLNTNSSVYGTLYGTFPSTNTMSDECKKLKIELDNIKKLIPRKKYLKNLSLKELRCIANDYGIHTMNGNYSKTISDLITDILKEEDKIKNI